MSVGPDAEYMTGRAEKGSRGKGRRRKSDWVWEEALAVVQSAGRTRGGRANGGLHVRVPGQEAWAGMQNDE